MNNIFITQYSIGFAGPAILAFIISGAIILKNIRGGNLTPDRISLSLYFLGASIYNILNFCGFSIYSERAQVVWYIESFAPFAVLFLIRFAYYYPAPWHEKERKVVLAAGSALAAASVAEYWINSWHSPVRLFGHNYGAEYFSSAIPLLNAFFYIWGISVFIRRAVFYEHSNGRSGSLLKAIIKPSSRESETARTFAGLLLIDVAHSFIVYGGMNKISVSIFIISSVTTVVVLIILSLYTFVYLHSSYDNIPFIYRLTGIPLIVITVIVTMSGYIMFYSRSISYDEMNRAVISGLKTDGLKDYSSGDFPLAYISVYKSNGWNVIYDKKNVIPDILNSWFWREAPSGMQMKTSSGIEIPQRLDPEGRYFIQINGVNYYQYNHRSGDNIYGFGIPYTDYLGYMHRPGLLILVLIVLSMLLVITLLPLLYYVGIIKPIRDVIHGNYNSALKIPLFENELGIMEDIIKTRTSVSRGKPFPETPEQLSEAVRGKLDVVIKYIGNNYHYDISREGLASMINLDTDYLSRLFKIYTGMKIGDYINRLRIDEACLLLHTENISVLDISMRVGFESLRTFNRTFFRFAGETPTSFRNKKTSGQKA